MFQSARLKLTGWYLLVIMTVSLSFSFVIYQSLVVEVHRFERAQRQRLERSFLIPLPPNTALIEETTSRIVFFLGVTNLFILVVSGGLGFMLAGRTLQPIKKMVDEQHRFISDASHELKTPLTSLKSSFEVYLRDKKPSLASAKELISDSIQDINKLQSLSESLLQLAHYDESVSRQKFEPLSVLQIIKESVSTVTPLAEKKRINISVDVDNMDTNGSKYSLVELFVILLDNAVKYSSIESEIKVVGRKRSKTVVIDVIDSGVGISQKDLPQVFDRFYRSDSARSKSDASGYGLGLSIAKKIVESHGGRIVVVSSPGKGSVFTVTLPRKL